MLPSELWTHARKSGLSYENSVKVGSLEHKMCAKILTYVNRYLGYTAYAKCRMCGKYNKYHVVYYGWSKNNNGSEINSETAEALDALDALVTKG